MINTEKATPIKEDRSKKLTLIVKLVDKINIFIIYLRSSRQANIYNSASFSTSLLAR
jgi:hypothetical protein